MLSNKRNVFAQFIIILTITSLNNYFALAEDCPEPDCEKEKKDPPKIPDGVLEMKVYYDNDALDDPYQWDTGMVLRACQVRADFPEHFKITFVVGAKATRNDNNELVCRADADQDRLEVCASVIVPDFSEFVCCNNDNGSVEKCSNDQGPHYFKAIQDCAKDKKSEELLINNSKERELLGILPCHLPDYLLNNVYNRCVKLDDYSALKAYACQLFKDNNVDVDKDKCKT